MIDSRFIVIVTLAICILAVLRLIQAQDWNAAGLLSIALAAFVLDRAPTWKEDPEANKDSPKGDESSYAD